MKRSNVKQFGIEKGNISQHGTQEERIEVLNFKLCLMGLPQYKGNGTRKGEKFLKLLDDVILESKENRRMASLNRTGITKRINTFLQNNFKSDLKVIPDLFQLEHHGLARELALPPNAHESHSEWMDTYRLKQGILFNPKNDKRTTKGSFHIAKGFAKIPFDKKEVPMETFEKLYKAACNPPEEYMKLPFTSQQEPENQAKTFVSVFLRPIISPEVKGYCKEKRMEILFVTPGNFVANLDFVESIFGNAGCPDFHANDSGLDVDGWSGTTGYVILAPHLSKLTKKEVGLPKWEEATDRQKRDEMCYRDEKELYNGGLPFKLTCRDPKSGFAMTIISDNYFGYTKKEVKTMISFTANIFGNVEEEHAGGTIAFNRVNLGNYANLGDKNFGMEGYSYDEVKERYADVMHIQADGYAIDKKYPSIIYLPTNFNVEMEKARITWQHEGKEKILRLKPGYTYFMANGTKISIEKHPIAPTYKLAGTKAEGIFVHKPCTVSGGGKSELSKSIENSIIYGIYYCEDLKKDFQKVRNIIEYDYKRRWKNDPNRTRESRKILSKKRTLGSVIKLLTPSKHYTDEFNKYLNEIPNHIKALVFLVKRFYEESWGDDWDKYFSVDRINGKTGNEVKLMGRKIRPSYVRVGFDENGSWRLFKLRMDFMAANKIQMEDDISASITLPAHKLEYLEDTIKNKSVKFTSNCEFQFFQRPDDAKIKGYDKKAEKDLSSNNVFISNFQQLNKNEVMDIKEDILEFFKYTKPVKNNILSFLESDYKYTVIPSELRICRDGKRSRNPRYLENRKDFENPINDYVAEMGMRLNRKVPLGKTILTPVQSVLAGRRNNPPEFDENGKKLLPLSVYNPIHYQPLPELFMDYICSLSGSSPSTTGAGSEGALTKGPFNMLLPIYDLNAALLYYILSEVKTFTTPAGYIGSKFRVDHDISMLIPEIWCRLTEEERDPQRLIKEGSFEKIEDFEHNGKVVKASRLGYRMTEFFCFRYLGKIFDDPAEVFTGWMLRPEKQGIEDFVDGVNNIVNSHEKIAKNYIIDGSADNAILPLKALIHIMATGKYEDMTIESPEFRKLFTRDYVIKSDWYKQRLVNKQNYDVNLMKKKIANLEEFISAKTTTKQLLKDYDYEERLVKAKKELKVLESPEYLKDLEGTLGTAIVL